MSKRPVSLTLHKTNQARRKAKQYRRDIADCGRWAARNFDSPLAGYAVIMWGTDGEGTAFWDGNELLGPVFLEDHVNTILRRTVARRVTRRLLDMDDPADV